MLEQGFDETARPLTAFADDFQAGVRHGPDDRRQGSNRQSDTAEPSAERTAQIQETEMQTRGCFDSHGCSG